LPRHESGTLQPFAAESNFWLCVPTPKVPTAFDFQGAYIHLPLSIDTANSHALSDGFNRTAADGRASIFAAGRLLPTLMPCDAEQPMCDKDRTRNLFSAQTVTTPPSSIGVSWRGSERHPLATVWT
jgi:hypothetical protein